MAKPKVKVRSQSELDLMRHSGRINAQALKKGLTSVRPGISLSELDQIVEAEIRRLGGEPAFQKVPQFHWATCINVNDGVVHGIPNGRIIQAGDLVSIDVGTVYQGWYSDGAWTVLVAGTEDQEQTAEKKKFMEVGKRAIEKAIEQCVEGNRIGDIASAMQNQIEGAGYSVVKSLAGHGVGRAYHEEPEVPGYGKSGTGMKLLTGMTLAIEAIYAMGQGEILQEEDGWTLSTVDGSLSGLFEHTVVVGKERPEVITNLDL